MVSNGRREKDKAMLLGLKRISTAFGVLALGASFATAQAPAPAVTPNQATANAVASALKSSRTLSAYRIEIEARSLCGPVVDINAYVDERHLARNQRFNRRRSCL